MEICINQINVPSIFILIVTAIELSMTDISLKPCHGLLQYRVDGFAVLTIPKPDDVNESIGLIVTLLLPVDLRTLYDARLTFVTITNDALVYRLNTPQSLPSPRVIRISVNGRPICSEPLMTWTPATTVHIHHVTTLEKSSNAGPTETSFNLNEDTLKFNDIQDGAVRNKTPKKEQHDISTERIIGHFGHDFNPKPPEGNCGRTTIGNLTLQRLANGDRIERGEFPWLAAMFVRKDNSLRYKCVANLISQKHVVTAGHCVKYMDQPAIEVSKVVVVFPGKHSQFENGEDGALKMEIKHIHLHSEHKTLGYMSDSDLAVLEFKTAIEFNNLIRPICLWSGPSDHLRDIVGEYGTVVGWELNAEGKLLRQEPRAVRIPIVSQEDCLWSNKEFVHFTSNRTFCAGIRDGKTGPCQGDSGGGLMLFRENRWMLRGVVSLSLSMKGTASCDLSNYVVFVDVAQYRAWFEQFL